MPRRTLLACLIAVIAPLALAGPGHAGVSPTFTVNTNSDDGDAVINGTCDTVDGMPITCSLRAAIAEANDTVASDTITFVVTPHLLGSQLTITNPTVIDGDISGVPATVDGNDTTRLFETLAPVTFKNIRLEDGGISGSDGGAAIRASGVGANLILDNVTVTSSQATGTGSALGAGVRVDGENSLTMTDSTVSDNTMNMTNDSYGAGIYAGGPLTMTDSTVSGNSFGGTATIREGAGIYADEGNLEITGSTISGNSGAVRGAGLLIPNFFLFTRTIRNSTFSGNVAGNGGGGGILTERPLTIENTTFDNNSGTNLGSDLRVLDTVTVKNTIFASSAVDSCANAGGSIVSATPGHNIDIGTTCGFGNTNGNQQNTDPDLLGLAVNAPGTTATHAIPPVSEALDNADPAANCGTAITTDQRGVLRPQPTGGSCDVGSFELEYRTLTVTRDGTGSGSVLSGPAGINCGIDCTEPRPQGSVTVLTAAPGVGSTFTGWTNCDAVSGPGGTICNQTLGADETVTATFDLIPRTLTVAKAGSGSGTVTGTGINCGLDCTEVVNHGTMVVLTAAPTTGSTFVSWTNCDNPVGVTCTQTLNADETATATFDLIPVVTPVIPTTPPTTPTAPKKCKKGFKLKKGKCRKKKRKK